MRRVLLLLLIATLQHHADTIDPLFPPLFASVTGVAEDDVLNVREKPDHKFKKVGIQVPDAFMGVERCKEIKGSTWCKVYQIAQNFYSEDFNPGWVNARFLKPFNRGYVLIDGVGNCDYVLQCKENKCKVVNSYDTDKNHQIIHVKTKWIERDRLKGESNFGAAKDTGGDGYCTSHSSVEEYFVSKKREAFSKKYH